MTFIAIGFIRLWRPTFRKGRWRCLGLYNIPHKIIQSIFHDRNKQDGWKSNFSTDNTSEQTPNSKCKFNWSKIERRSYSSYDNSNKRNKYIITTCVYSSIGQSGNYDSLRIINRHKCLLAVHASSVCSLSFSLTEGYRKYLNTCKQKLIMFICFIISLTQKCQFHALNFVFLLFLPPFHSHVWKLTMMQT